MKYRLMELLVCPECGGPLQVEAWRTEESAPGRGAGQGCTGCYFGDAACTRCYSVEIMEGLIICRGCLRAYPIIGGVPRMLPDDLRETLWQYHRGFFERRREIIPLVFAGAEVARFGPFASAKQATYSSFSFQRIELTPPDLRYAQDWMSHFRARVAPHDGAYFQGQLGLDAGCGFGRHLYCAHACGAEVVGLDISEGVQRAFENNLANPRVHVVQGDIYRMPFRPGTFDFALAFGVLHHLPNPRQGFESVARAVRPDGEVKIWVYGYEGMSWSYRLSHMRTLRRLTTRLPKSVQWAACSMVALVLEAVLWLPYRLLSRWRWTRKIADRFPAQSNSRQPFHMKITAVFDRLGTPITYFHNREELLGWYRDASFSAVQVWSEDRRGWQATGRKSPPPHAPNDQLVDATPKQRGAGV